METSTRFTRTSVADKQKLFIWVMIALWVGLTVWALMR